MLSAVADKPAAPVLSADTRPIGTEHPSVWGRAANDPRGGATAVNESADVSSEDVSSEDVGSEDLSPAVVDASVETDVETQADTEETKKQG